MSKIINDAALDQIFRQARTHRSWTSDPVSDVVLQAAYDLARMAPTSANCSPMRIVFVKSPEAKERLKPALSEEQRRADDEGAGDRDHRLRSAVL